MAPPDQDQAADVSGQRHQQEDTTVTTTMSGNNTKQPFKGKDDEDGNKNDKTQSQNQSIANIPHGGNVISKADDDIMDDDDPQKASSPDQLLSTREKWSLAFLVLAYACTMSSTTLLVGALPLVVLSVGGSRQISPFALGSIFLGSAGISLVTTSLFTRWGRRVGFVVGAMLGVVGTGVCALAIVVGSPGLVILGGAPIGAANGLGMYVRFAAMEIVSLESYHAMAVTLVLSGGVLAAFAGPESAQAATQRDSHLLGPDGERRYPFLGIMVVAAIFYLGHAVFVSLVPYPRMTSQLLQNNNNNNTVDSAITLRSLLARRTFWVPAVVASLCWAIMAMPMSLVRVAMKDVGYSQRTSLTTIELHFLGMFAPGLVITNRLLQTYGPRPTACMAVLVFGIAELSALLAKRPSSSSNGGSGSSVAAWMVALILLGVGWNLGFSSATVLLAKEGYASAPHLKPSVQAANDLSMFLFAGIGIFSTGYIYKAGGSGLSGWRTVIYVVLGLTVLLALIVGMELYRHSKPKPESNVAADGEKDGAKLPMEEQWLSSQPTRSLPGDST